MLIWQIVVFLIGLWIIYETMISAVRTFVMPRAVVDPITQFVFRSVRRVFNLFASLKDDYDHVDRVLALYAPVSLLALPPTWLFLLSIGFANLYWATGIPDWLEAFTVSGSSILTLGFARGPSFFHTALSFAAATIGLIFVALLISYLPTMYTNFSRRETFVNQLSVRAGTPPSPVEMLMRYHRLDRIADLGPFWENWERWFVEVEESHTSLAALVFFRSPLPDHSWVNAAGAVMDAAALRLSVIDLRRSRHSIEGLPSATEGQIQIPSDARAAIAIRAGFIALRRICDFFDVPYNPDPLYPNDPISITREEFEQAVMLMGRQGIPVAEDLDQAWEDFAGWRVNYDSVLNALKELTFSPECPWIKSLDGPLVPAEPPRGPLTRRQRRG